MNKNPMAAVTLSKTIDVETWGGPLQSFYPDPFFLFQTSVIRRANRLLLIGLTHCRLHPRT